MKQIIRRNFLELRSLLPTDKRVSNDKLISGFVLGLEDVKEAKKIGCYCNQGSEVDTRFILSRLLDLKKEVYLPVIKDKNNKAMEFVKLNSLDDLKDGPFSLEPKNKDEILVDVIDVILVPLLAFDRCGARLGFGHGYYDRYMAHKSAIKIGLAYSIQEFKDGLPIDIHDVPLDYVVTEKEVIKCQKR